MLARQKLVAPQHRFGPAQIDRDVAVFHALDQTVDDLADAVLVFLELALPFGLADLLDDDLLGGLGGDPAEIDRRQFVGQELAEGGVLLHPLGFAQRELGRLVLDRLDHFEIAHQVDVAGLAVDARPDVVLVPVLGAASLLNRLLHRFQDFVPVDVLFAGDRIGYL